MNKKAKVKHLAKREAEAEAAKIKEELAKAAEKNKESRGSQAERREGTKKKG